MGCNNPQPYLEEDVTQSQYMRSFILALYATLVSNFVYQGLEFFYVDTSVDI